MEPESLRASLPKSDGEFTSGLRQFCFKGPDGYKVLAECPEHVNRADWMDCAAAITKAINEYRALYTSPSPDSRESVVSIKAVVDRMEESCGISWWVTLVRSDRPESAKIWDDGRMSLFQFREAPDMDPPAKERAEQTAAELNGIFEGVTVKPWMPPKKDSRNDVIAALEEIRRWADAYPVTVFTEPDFEKAHKVLTENGMTLDGISAAVIRTTLERVKNIADKALKNSPPPPPGWVSVEERLPEKRDEPYSVQVCDVIDKSRGVRLDSGLRLLAADAKANGERCAWTHWAEMLPLPIPPKA